MKNEAHDLLGISFGRWRVIARGERRNHHRHWVCRCACGRQKEVSGTHLLSGRSRGCGCDRAPLARGRFSKHGLHGSPEYIAWCGMKDRCSNHNSRFYHCYGGRGIAVCERWRSSFEDFLSDMGARPSIQYSIDRIDNDGNYEPDNCRWADRATQRRNSRRIYLVTFQKETLCLQDWADRIGINRGTLYSRLHRKPQWTIEEALTTPLKGF